MISSYCPSCGATLRHSEGQIGQQKKCPSCGTRLVVTATGAVTVSRWETDQVAHKSHDSTDNLRRWNESGQPRKWVKGHEGQWNHQDWLALLAALKQSSYWPMEPAAVGAVLEEIKGEWQKQARPTRNEGREPKHHDTAIKKASPVSDSQSSGRDVKPMQTPPSTENFTSTFNCPRCNAVHEARYDNLSSPFICSSCGHKSRHTFGELDWYQYRRDNPDMPMPPPPDATVPATDNARQELIAQMYKEGVAQGLSFEEITRRTSERLFGRQGKRRSMR